LWIVRISDDYSECRLFEKLFIFRFRAKKYFKKMAKQLQLVKGHTVGQGYAHRFLSMNFGSIRLTIIHSSVDDSKWFSDEKLPLRKLDFEVLNNNWKEYK